MSLEGKKNAWVNPSGQFIEVGFMGHDEFARKYFEEKYGREDASEKIGEICGSILSSYPYQALHKLGWIRLLTWTQGSTRALGDCTSFKVTDNTMSPTANRKQLDTLLEWCKDNHFKYMDLFKQ